MNACLKEHRSRILFWQKESIGPRLPQVWSPSFWAGEGDVCVKAYCPPLPQSCLDELPKYGLPAILPTAWQPERSFRVGKQPIGNNSSERGRAPKWAPKHRACASLSHWPSLGRWGPQGDKSPSHVLFFPCTLNPCLFFTPAFREESSWWPHTHQSHWVGAKDPW